MRRTAVPGIFFALVSLAGLPSAGSSQVIDIGSRRELFVDRFLIDQLRNAELQLGKPLDAGPVLPFDRPWEGAFSNYVTVIQDAGVYRLYYRGEPVAGDDGNPQEVTCYAESRDGKQWTKPHLGFYEVKGTRNNNVILANDPPFSHNFSPLVDTRPGVLRAERFKALAGTHQSGLVAFVSGDGVRWRKLREEPVLPRQQNFAFDSQNLAFWSESKQAYLCYFRTWKTIGGTSYRWVSRSTSKDFVHWSPPAEMSYGEAPPEHLYTNQTSPYFRAPHLYISICARFLPGRQVLSEEQAKSVNVDPGYYKDCSDAVLVTSRGGNRYDRTFLEAFLRPGVGWENWVSRSNYPALNVVESGAAEMSFYVARNYGQPTAYLRRYALRLDGFASIHAPYGGGEALTKPFRFQGNRLEINYSTSAAGGIRVEILDEAGAPFPGYDLAEANELIGDEIARIVSWKGGSDLRRLAGKTVRLRFVMKDADL
ncbi:MAG: hypothetical protein HY236_09980, partial [Acidobacteria bacterium]|nr:hypothetical protein [Acidobacteriota bacterium]